MENLCKICGNNCSPGECFYPYGTQLEIHRSGVIGNYSKAPKEFFDLSFSDSENMFVFDAINNSMKCAPFHEVRYSGAIGGFFDLQKTEFGYKISYEGVQMPYFNVIVAVYEEGCWRLRFRFLTAPNQIYFSSFNEMHTFENPHTLKLPEKFLLNTALVVGLKSTTINITVNMFRAYYGTVSWTPESVNISEALKLAQFHRVDPNYAHRCPDCLVISPDGNGHISPCPPMKTVSSPRMDIYSNTMTRVFQIRFEKPCSIQVLDDNLHAFVNVNSGMHCLTITFHLNIVL